MPREQRLVGLACLLLAAAPQRSPAARFAAEGGIGPARAGPLATGSSDGQPDGSDRGRPEPARAWPALLLRAATPADLREVLARLGIGQEHETYIKDRVFHCTKRSGFKGQFTLCQALLGLSVACLVIGSVAALIVRIPQSRVQTLRQAPSWVDAVMLACSCIGSCCGYVARLFSNLMVIFGFWYCGHCWLMAAAIVIQLVAQLIAAYEYSYEEKESLGKAKNLLISLLQARAFVDAYHSWKKNEESHRLARQKFVDAIFDSGPFAIFAVYVIFYFEINYDIWLTLSVFSSVLGLAYYMVGWMAYTLNKQLAEDEVQPDIFSLGTCHQLLWLSYFSTDFSLRLVTLGLFLSIDELHPQNQLVFVLLVLVYFFAVAIPIKDHTLRQGRTFDLWQINNEEMIAVRRTIVANSALGALVFSFLVNALPADMRLAPRNSKESHLLFALDPEVRRQILRYIIPLRATEYVLLSVTAMVYHFDPWKCAALVVMFICTHVLLAAVLQVQGPKHVERAPGDEAQELIRNITGASHSSCVTLVRVGSTTAPSSFIPRVNTTAVEDCS